MAKAKVSRGAQQTTSAADVEVKDPEVKEQFLAQAEPPKGEVHQLLQEQAEALTKDSIDGSEDAGGNIEAAPNGFEEVGERVYHQEIDPRRHRWGTLSNEPVDAVVFNQTPRAEPKDSVVQAQQQQEQQQDDTNANGDKG
jgi:hypothetical protein